MLDFLTRRRLLICLTATLFVTISILFIAQLHSTFVGSDISLIYSSTTLNTSITKAQETFPCYLTETVDLVESCQKCDAFSKRSNAMGCSPTGFRELLFCPQSNIKVYRSCPIPVRVQKERFWYFQGVTFCLSILSIFSVYFRQKTLDKHMVEKIKRQIEISDE
ncbi:hypothetical protein I4U23_025392 [Adineta vaga]|nr:hypothetical protein I4U23_025392 [Adineta vaga]